MEYILLGAMAVVAILCVLWIKYDDKKYSNKKQEK